MSGFQELKLRILEILGVSKDAAHVHIGLVVFFVVALLARRHSAWLPWAAVLAVALGLEALDLRDDLATYDAPRWGASLHDLVNTMIWPTVLAIASGRLRGRASRADPIATTGDQSRTRYLQP